MAADPPAELPAFDEVPALELAPPLDVAPPLAQAIWGQAAPIAAHKPQLGLQQCSPAPHTLPPQGTPIAPPAAMPPTLAPPSVEATPPLLEPALDAPAPPVDVAPAFAEPPAPELPQPAPATGSASNVTPKTKRKRRIVPKAYSSRELGAR